MPTFLRWIGVLLTVTFVTSVLALACIHTRRPSEFDNLQRVVRTTVHACLPIVKDLRRLIRSTP